MKNKVKFFIESLFGGGVENGHPFIKASITSKYVCKHLALGSWRESRSIEPNYSLKYKLEWRIISILQKLLSPFHYIILKIN